MTHRKIEEIEAHGAEVAKANERIKAEKRAKIEAATQKINEEYAEREKRIREDATRLHTELEQAKIAAASHPLEGQTVYKQEVKQDRSYLIRSRDKVVKLRGVVTVIRDYKDFPERKNNDRFARIPEFGDVIIQRVDAKGNKLKSWVKIYDGDILPQGWAVEEENVV